MLVIPAKAGTQVWLLRTKPGPPIKALGGDEQKYVIPAKAGTQVLVMKDFYVYILCNKPYGTLYTGVTSNLVKRIYEHRNNLAEGFTRKYDVHRLVWFERHESGESAISREKQIKKWERSWKVELVEAKNPLWKDLYESILE